MDARRDALAAAAEIVLAAEAAALAEPGCVATVGSLAVRPGAGERDPGRRFLSLDVRGESGGRDRARRRRGGRGRVGGRRGAGRSLRGRRTAARSPSPFRAPSAGRAAAADGAAPRRWRPSRAPATTWARLASRVPGALLFVPLVEGESHSPVEVVRAEDVALALDVLLDVLAAAATRLPPYGAA